MTALCGAWSLTEARVGRLLPESERRAILEARGVGGGPISEILTGRLWLNAAPDRVDRRGGRVLAWEGFSAFDEQGPWSLVPRLEGRSGGLRPADDSPGDRVAVLADLDRGELSILRDPAGGEPLYFRVEPEILLFSTSLRAVLAYGGKRPLLDRETVFERGVGSLIFFGDRTLIEGVREVLPGHRLLTAGGAVSQRWAWDGLLEPVEGSVPELAGALKARLTEAVASCIGRDGRAAVALSGGIDSSCMAAMAAQLVGPERVTALTYEYDDQSIPSELPYAQEVCRALRIRDHRVFRITFDDFTGVIPEAVGLMEDPRFWRRAYPIFTARAARAAGFDRFLTGFGIGSHMAYLEEFSSLLRWLPYPQGALRYWASRRDPTPGTYARWGALHPGFEPPFYRLQYLMLCVLRHRGVLGDLRPFFPGGLGARVEEALASSRVASVLRRSSDQPLARQLQHLAFVSLDSCVDVVRCGRISRLSGASWLGPAHFPGVLPYCYMPARAGLPPFDPRSRLRPGKLLLREAMRGILPETVLARPKLWAHTPGSQSWLSSARSLMAERVGGSWDALREVFGEDFEAAKAHDPESMISMAYWHKLLLSGSSPA